MTNTTVSPRIYVASLSDYNAAILHGVWIDCEGKDADDIMEEVRAMLSTSPTAKRYGEVAEEWAIHDQEGFPNGAVGEFTGFDRVAELVEALEEHGELLAVALDYYGGNLDEALEACRDHYIGSFRSKEDWAEEWLRDCGELERVPASLLNYIDFQAYARDAELGGEILFLEEAEGPGFHVFHAS